MGHKIFINLPVTDLDRSKAFYSALGFTINPQFTDETAACIVISEEIYVMALTHAKLAQFTPKPIVDARTYAAAIHALTVDNKADVAAMSEKALKAGGREPAPEQDYGFMIQRSFEDPDGHHWEVIWMDPAHIQ